MWCQHLSNVWQPQIRSELSLTLKREEWKKSQSLEKFWMHYGTSGERFNHIVIFESVMKSWEWVFAKLDVVKDWARVSNRSEHCSCPQRNSLFWSECTLACLCACLCGGYECGFGRQRRCRDDSALHHWQRHAHRGKGTDASLLWRCVSLCLCVWSLSEVDYIIAKCEHSATGPSNSPLCTLRNIPDFPFSLIISSADYYHQSVSFFRLTP